MAGLRLQIGNELHEGWKAAQVTRSIETACGSFSLELSERDPGVATPREIRPGDPCAVSLDGEVVITGFIDTVGVNYNATSHNITVTGRDRAADLVDCSVSSQPGEWHDERLEAIAAALAAPFRVVVVVGTGINTGAPFARFKIEEGESAWEAIERACRFRAVLPLSDGRGRLVLGRPARTRAAVELVHGENILAASSLIDWTNRYSNYTLLGQQPGSDFLTGSEAAHVIGNSVDRGVTRFRPLTILAEQGLTDMEALERIEWEASIRAARARSAAVSVQGWRETPDGALWEPGRLVIVSDPWLGLERELLISGVRQAITERGTTTTLQLYPEGAFLPRAIRQPDPTGLFV